MAREFARAFYNSEAWTKCRNAYRASRHYLCEACGEPGMYVHHRTHLTPKNIHTPKIALGFDNLQLLCAKCHKAVHNDGYAVDADLTFDADGNLVQK